MVPFYTFPRNRKTSPATLTLHSMEHPAVKGFPTRVIGRGADSSATTVGKSVPRQGLKRK